MKHKTEKNPHRKSPPRTGLHIEKGVTKAGEGINPEITENKRTKELATDQSIAARNLLYHPNEASIAVMERCADGISSVMDRLNHTGNAAVDLANDEILISMCSRLMADGGVGRILGFNEKLALLVDIQKKESSLEKYGALVQSLAKDCRANMTHITTEAKKPGDEGALARQGILSFMGDLGGLEPQETGFGAAYKGPLCKADRVYKTYVAGLCDAQLKLRGQAIPASAGEVEAFEKLFDRSRKETSMKGGGLSAPAHTAGKKEQRAPIGWIVQERKGLLNTGDLAEKRLMDAEPGHKKMLVDASWPSYLVSKEVIQDVVEPVTGHVSGTFGEMATTMNMFCGTPPASVTWKTPSGTPIPSASKDQVTAIAALSAAGLLTAGFHSAVEVFQPMSTFTTYPTHGSLGPKAVEDMNNQAKSLRNYADNLDTYKNTNRPEKWEHDGYALSEEELMLSKEALVGKAKSIEHAATKSVDMMALLQGEGGTIATLEVISVLANHSTDPKMLRELFSLNTRLDALSLSGHTPELEKARELAQSPVNKEDHEKNLEVAIKTAEIAAAKRNLLYTNAARAEATAATAEEKAATAEEKAAVKELVLDMATKATKDAVTAGWGEKASPETIRNKAMKDIEPLEEVRKQTFREARVARAEATAVRAEATAARSEAIVARSEATSKTEEIIAAAKKEAAAARERATAARVEATKEQSSSLLSALNSSLGKFVLTVGIAAAVAAVYVISNQNGPK